MAYQIGSQPTQQYQPNKSIVSTVAYKTMSPAVQKVHNFVLNKLSPAVRDRVSPSTYTYKPQNIQSLQGMNVVNSAQTDWQRYRNPETAILDMLSPAAKASMEQAGLQINLNLPQTTPSFNTAAPLLLQAMGQNSTPQLNIPVQASMTANAIRHELLHAGLNLTPNLLPRANPLTKLASTPTYDYSARLAQSLLGNNAWTNRVVRQNESAAITMGGAAAYPGLTPSNVPYDFREFFNINVPSWNYGG